MKKTILLLSLFWLLSCTAPVAEDGRDSPTRLLETSIDVSLTPTLANQAITTGVPAATLSTDATVIPAEAISPKATAITLTSTPVPAIPAAEAVATRIQFEPGMTSAAVSDRLDAGESTTYLAWADSDQQMYVELASTNNAANFAVAGMSDGQPYKRLVNEDRFWTGTLLQSQDYQIQVTSLEAVNFTILLEIDAPGEDVLQPVWPVVDGTSGIMLGGSHNGQWLDALTVMPSLQDGERPYQIYAGSLFQGPITGSPPSGTQAGPCGGTPTVLFPANSDLADAIAMVAGWDAAPRQPESLPLDTAVYQEMVAEYLRAQSIVEPDVRLASIDKIDLEGDGVDEVLITASRLDGLGHGLPTAAAGDYSLVILRKLVDGAVVSIPLAVELFVEAVELADPVQYRILALLDLNGNGELEIVVESLHYEGRFVTVYEINNQEAHVVLTSGCRL